MTSALAPRDRRDFHIALLCALPLEAEVMTHTLDQVWKDERYNPLPNDDSAYTLGTIGRHNVVIVYIPGMGTYRAAAGARNLKSSYPGVKLALVVGVCGGIPEGRDDKEILLGDVVISKSLIQFDIGKQYVEGFKSTDTFNTLGTPNKKTLDLLSKLETEQYREKLRMETVAILQAIQQKISKANHPGLEHDILYNSSYAHRHRKPGQCYTCEMTDDICDDAMNTKCEDLGCESSELMPRQRLLDLSKAEPIIHIGAMGCTNTVMKSAHFRDYFARKEKIIAVEMEGAGVWRHGPSLIIKGVCDYADSHKRKRWQRYAAATAAACTKAFLLEWWAPETHENSSDKQDINKYFDVPAQRVKTLFGREDELMKIATFFERSRTDFDRPRILVLQAIGGQGKSQIALEHCYRTYAHETHHGIFWVDGSSDLTIIQSLVIITRQISGIIAETLPDDESKARYGIRTIERWEHRWLIVFDNCDDVATFFTLGQKFLPTVGKGDLLFTTRHQGLGELGHLMSIPPMSPEAGVKLLLHRYGTDTNHDEYMTEGLKIVENFGGHALAIDQISTYLQYKRIPLDQLHTLPLLYHTQRDKVLERTTADVWNDMKKHGQDERQSPVSAFTTWEMSYQQLLHDVDGTDKLAQLMLHIGFPPTDSGYGTLTNPTTIEQKTQFEEDDDDDSSSIKTDNESLPMNEDLKHDLTVSFVDEICQRLNEVTELDHFAVDDVASILARLLKSLSESLKPQAVSKIQKNSVIFLRHYRRVIANQFKEYIEFSLQSDIGAKQKAADLPSAERKVNDWNWSPEGDIEAHIDELDGMNRDDDVHDDKQHTQFYPESRAFIVESLEFQHFLTKAATSMTLTPRKNTYLQSIDDKVSKSFSAWQSDIEAATRTAMLDVKWCPIDLIRPEDLSGQILPLKEALSLTGTQAEAQAALVGRYIEQVWPITGEATINALEKAVQSQWCKNLGPFQQIEYRLSELTIVKITQVEPNILLEVNGEINEIMEVTEQFAWLGSACRLSPYKDQGCIVAPDLTVESVKDVLMLKVTFRTTRFRNANFALSPTRTWNCWRDMLCKPVIVRNFPIKARRNGERGLELPLYLMTILGCANQATIFDNGIVLKGFSSIFVPMQYNATVKSIQWHFACTSSKARMSYWEADKINPHRRELPFISTEILKSCRHFVGWTPAAVMQLGLSEVDYESIGYCGPNFSRPGCALEKVTISGSQNIGLGATFGKLNRHIAVNLRGSSEYENQINDARAIYVILYDTNDRRGWLVDGASALLHIARARLASKRIRSSTVFKMEDFQQLSDQNSLDFALNTLLDSKNRGLPIYENWETETVYLDSSTTAETKRTRILWTFQDLVSQTWETLLQIVEHQSKLSELPGVGLRGTTRDKLEGFGLKDIVEGKFPLKPRFTILGPSGRGWADLTRKINAITLMATNLGELIVPSDSIGQLCLNWQLVPTGRDYLAACIWLLQEICDWGGNQNSHPMELFDGIFWHKGSHLFEPCTDQISCGSYQGCDRVQVLLPPSLGHKTHPEPFAHTTGAALLVAAQDTHGDGH